jgi:hypothetical protein
MKKIILLIALMVIAVCIFTACSKGDSTNNANSPGGGITFSCNGITPKFSTDVQPILNTVCSINSNCHAGGSVNSGGSLTTFAEVNAKKSNIRAQILSGAMPQTGTITQAQINAFICWIDNGAPNN